MKIKVKILHINIEQIKNKEQKILIASNKSLIATPQYQKLFYLYLMKYLYKLHNDYKLYNIP